LVDANALLEHRSTARRGRPAAQAAALAQSAPLAERIAQLEGGQKQLWTTINDKLDKITLDVAQTSKDVAVLSQRVNDNDAHSTQRDNDRRK